MCVGSLNVDLCRSERWPLIILLLVLHDRASLSRRHGPSVKALEGDSRVIPCVVLVYVAKQNYGGPGSVAPVRVANRCTTLSARIDPFNACVFSARCARKVSRRSGHLGLSCRVRPAIVKCVVCASWQCASDVT